MLADPQPDALERLVQAYGDACALVAAARILAAVRPDSPPALTDALAACADARAALVAWIRARIEPDPAVSIATPTTRTLRRFEARPSPEDGDQMA